MNRIFFAVVTLLPPLVFLLGHGYDLIVSYVAARNVVEGVSPYDGGVYSNPSYPSTVQGIGETPFWPLWLSAAYVLSGGDLLLFNGFSKIPIVLSLFALWFSFRKSGIAGAEFYLLNPFVLMTSVAWGKPDAVSAALFLLAMLKADKPGYAAVLTAVSLNIKPIALGAVPAFAAYYGLRRGLLFLLFVAVLSLFFFLAPFVLFGWNISTPLGGTVNWLKQAGGLSPLNILQLFYGWSYDGIHPFGYLVGIPWVVAVSVASAAILLRRPRGFGEFAWLALLGGSVFLLTRPWISEQNLILPFLLIHLVSGKPPSKKLWLLIVSFAVVNTSAAQLLYPVWPTITIDFYNSLYWLEPAWVVGRFVLSLVFYWFFVKEVLEVRGSVVGLARAGGR